jgi:hypothetical protein
MQQLVAFALSAVVTSIACGGRPAVTTTPANASVRPEVTSQELAHLVQACERDSDPARCYAAAVIVGQGFSADAQDPARARTLVDRGHDIHWRKCVEGAAESCRFIVAIANRTASKTTDPAERRLVARVVVGAGSRGCRAGDLELCLDVAAILFRGEAGEADPQAARDLTSYACDRDNQEACVELALLLHGSGATDDRERVTGLLERACERGRGDGCAALATLRLADPAAAAAARLAAARGCELDDAGGCAILGHCLLDGIGGDRDQDAAVVAFTKACRGGDSRGCRVLESIRK